MLFMMFAIAYQWSATMQAFVHKTDVKLRCDSVQQVQDAKELLLCTYLEKYSCFSQVRNLSEHLVRAVLRMQAPPWHMKRCVRS